MINLMKKHGKWIFAILGAFLMVTFAVRSPFSGTPVQDLEYGRLDGKKVTTGQINGAVQEMKLLGQFRLMQDVVELIQEKNEMDGGTHWFLLTREAAKEGFEITAAEISQEEQQVPAETLSKTLDEMGLARQDLDVCINHGLLIRKMTTLALSSIPIPVPQIEYSANEELSAVRIQYVMIDGKKNTYRVATTAAATTQPTAADIQKQFDLYKDVQATLSPDAATPQQSPATQPSLIDGHRFPFGYKYPDRVKVEFLKLSRAPVAASISATRDDYQEAYKYYSTHPDEFKNAQSNSPSAATRPFEEVGAQLVNKQVNERIDKFLKKEADFALQMAKEPWSKAKADVGGLEAIPREQWTDYTTVVQAVKGNRQFDGFAPEYKSISDWQTKAELAKASDIGQAFYQNQNGKYSFPDLAAHVRELEPPKDDFPRLFPQVGVEGPILQDDNGNLYIYRITDAQKTHDPASVDEVKPQVVEDLKRRAVYEAAQTEAKALADAATKIDLSELAHRQGLTPITIPKITHSGDDFPDVRAIPGFVDAAFSLAKQAGASAQPATQSAKLPTPTITVNNDTTLSAYAIAQDQFFPASPLLYAEQLDKYFNNAQQQSSMVMLFGWIRLDAVAKRMNYVPKNPFATADAGM